MTPLGHAAFSYGVGRGSRRWIPLSLAGVIVGGVLPDVDFVLLWAPQFNAWHRVITHNLLVCLLAALLAAGIGAALGWTGHTIVGKRDKIAQGKAKGEKMVAAVQKISDARKSVSLAMEDLKKDIAQDPAGSAEKITTLLTESFDRQPQISELFGWQLASVDPNGLRAAFQLYEQVTELQQNLGLMAKVLGSYGNFIKVGGPQLYGVTFSPSGAQMVGIADSLCGELPPEGEPPPEAIAALKPCGPDVNKAVAYLVLDADGGEPRALLRGVGEGRVQLLLAEGKVYDYAIGIEQKNNATNFYKMALARTEESLNEMNQVEERALNALKRYSEDPNVDGPAPSAEGGGGEGE
ncbi:MAG: metal-dependent hydrolase [Myxococcales bacterium]|nr:metal-dependent hydrolase [Myxococcales bacterium]